MNVYTIYSFRKEDTNKMEDGKHLIVSLPNQKCTLSTGMPVFDVAFDKIQIVLIAKEEDGESL